MMQMKTSIQRMDSEDGPVKMEAMADPDGETILATQKAIAALFGVEKDVSFLSSIGQIHQTWEGHDLYPSIEEKAAMLLYLVVKNHSFVDGNNRIAAPLFLCGDFRDKTHTGSPHGVSMPAAKLTMSRSCLA